MEQVTVDRYGRSYKCAQIDILLEKPGITEQELYKGIIDILKQGQ